MVRELLAVGADSNVTDMNADTPLFVAVKERHSAAATELIAGGRADVRRRDAARGRQPVHYAAELGLTSVVTALLDAGSDVNTADADGRTALMLATIGGHEDVARLTMDRDGCDVNVVDSTQRTSLFYAAQLGLVDTVRRLLQVRPLSVCNTFCYLAYWTSMSVLVVVGPKCKLTTSNAAPWRVTVSMPPRQTVEIAQKRRDAFRTPG